MAFGTFDLVHLGHVRYLEQAKRRGDKLVVVVTTDAWARKEKGRRPHFSGPERVRLVSALKSVDKAILGGEGDKYRVVQRERPDLIVLGYDAHADLRTVRRELARRGLKARVVRARAFAPGRYKGTLVRERLKREGRKR
jgi:FAD synthetase